MTGMGANSFLLGQPPAYLFESWLGLRHHAKVCV